MKPVYPFEEFSQHYDDIYPILDADGSDFFRTTAVVCDYMKERYPIQEATFKSGRFMLVMHYVSSHIHDFDQSDYAVYGSKRTGALVNDHLLKAIHQWFTETPMGALRDPKPEEIMTLADTLKD